MSAHPEAGGSRKWGYFVAAMGGVVAGALAPPTYRSIKGPSPVWHQLTEKVHDIGHTLALHGLAITTPKPGRLILGRLSSGALIANENLHSSIVVGPKGSGKSSGLVIPAILEWQGPVIAVSAAGSGVLENTISWRKRIGSVHVYDPSSATGYGNSTWSPLSGAEDWDFAQRTARNMVHAEVRFPPYTGSVDFWSFGAAQLLALHFFAAACNRHALSNVVRLLEQQDVAALADLVQATGHVEAIAAVNSFRDRDERARYSVNQRASAALRGYRDPKILQSAGSGDIAGSNVVGSDSDTLYLCMPSDERGAVRPLVSTLLHQVIRAAYKYEGAPSDPPLLLIIKHELEEPLLDNIDTVAATCSGIGIQLVSVWDDFSHIQRLFGDRAQRVVDNHRVKITLEPGQGRRGSLTYQPRPPKSLRLRSWYEDSGLAAKARSDSVEPWDGGTI